jgi:hypothetical protein
LIDGEPGETYRLVSTMDFQSREAAGTVTNVTGIVEYIDPSSAG